MNKELALLGSSIRPVWIEQPKQGNWLDGIWADIRLLVGASREMRESPAGTIFHYSPFAFGAHGIPMLAPLLPILARRYHVPITTVLHELCFPWGRNGLKGLVWAATQRLALVPVVVGSNSLIVTNDANRNWLAKNLRPLAKKVASIPVWSNIPVEETNIPKPAPGQNHERRLGSFGWASRDAEVEVVLDALSQMRTAGLNVKFTLIGAPGPSSDEGIRWRKGAETRGLGGRLAFTGSPVTRFELSTQLSVLEVYLHLDSAGPTAARSSLAAALSHGKPVVAFTGPLTWQALKPETEIVLIPPNPIALADCLTQLLESEIWRLRLGRGARLAYQREMDPGQAARIIKSIVLGDNVEGKRLGTT